MEKGNFKSRKIQITTFIFLLLPLCFLSAYDTEYADVWVKQISFNYESGNTDDAIDLCKTDDDDDIEAPEYIYSPASNENFAYIKNQSDRKIKVKFDSDCDSMHLLINISVYSGTGFGEVCNLFVQDYEPSDEITITLDGSVPNNVSKNTVEWKWEIYAISKDPSYCSQMNVEYTEHDYYVLLTTPQAPMAKPWTDVLDDACVWASGQTSIESAACEITESIYESGFNYVSEARYGTGSTFNLTQLISELGSSYSVNCLDMGKAVVTYCNAIGCDLKLVKFEGDFPINCIDPIGTTPAPTNNPGSSPSIYNDCRNGGWSYHAFAQNDDKDTWDACLKYDTDSRPDNVVGSDPSCGSTTTGEEWELPCNESESTYIQHLVDDWIKFGGEDIKDCSDPEDCGTFNYENSIVLL